MSKEKTLFYFGVITVISTVFGLQMLRVLLPSFVGYLRDSVGISSVSLAPLALLVFSLVFLAGFVHRWVGTRPYFLVTIFGLVLVRVIEQWSTSALFDLLFSSIGVVLFLFYLPMAYSTALSWKNQGAVKYGLFILLGIAVDTALSAGFGTLDLSWQPGLIPVIGILIIGAVLAGSLYLFLRNFEAPIAEPGWRINLSLAAFGPWLFLQMLVFQNIPRLSAMTGFETPAAASIIIAGNALAILLIIGLFNRGSKNLLYLSIISGIFMIVSTLPVIQISSTIMSLVFLAGQISAALVFIFFIPKYHAGVQKEGMIVTSVQHGIGYLLFILLVFLYYLTFDIQLGFRAQALLPVAAVLCTLGAVYSSYIVETKGNLNILYTTAAVSFSLLIFPAVLQFTWNSPEFIQPQPGNRSVNIMTYNLHNGFNTDGRLDLESLASVIEKSGADVIGLQEVSRGWLIWGAADTLLWLSQRLGMPYISGPTADPQWGNAILSRYPLDNIQLETLPPEDLLIRRGFIQADVDIGYESINIVVTHFHHRLENSEIREGQSAEIIENLQPGKPTVFMGDLNATPDSNEIQMLAEADLVDVAAEIGNPPNFTYYSAEPERQIDYIWHTMDLQASQFEIFKTTASDHFPVFSAISIPEE